jgi:transposase
MIIPDGRDIRVLQMFFDTYKDMTTSELAQLANCQMETIRRWKKKCGIKIESGGWGSGLTERPLEFQEKQKKINAPPPLDREIWNNQPWFHQKYVVDGLGAGRIGRLIGKDSGYVYAKLKQFKIETRKTSGGVSKNPCCNREWLVQHYEIEGLSLKKCAKIANVCAYTILRWLAKFNIYIRDRREATSGERNGFYGKKHTPEVLALLREYRKKQLASISK